MTEVERYSYDGNAVRVHTAPIPSREERDAEERRRRNKARRERENRKKAAMARSRRHTFRLCLIAAFCAATFFCYVYLQAETQTTMRHVASLEDEISTLKADNSAEKNRISGYENLNQVKETAQNSLGMVYAGQGQIVYYTVDDSDYMNQYDDVK